MPEFPGGSKALLEYVKKNLRYPEEDNKGVVYVSFIVSKTGKISNIRIVRGVSRACDMEAIRLIKEMPRWIPAKQNGQPVDVRYTIPVRFKI
jgi:periplasmic protein TonB